MGNVISGGVLATAGGGLTLAELVASYRKRLDDTIIPYLWSNDELVEYVNELLHELCEDVPMLNQDSTTAQICSLSVTASEPEVTISPVITAIVWAKLDSQSYALGLATRQNMDYAYPSWKDAEDGVPFILVTDHSRNVVRLHPPPTDADTLRLTVYRLPLTDLSWDVDQSNTLDIPSKFSRRLVDGVLAKAYLKQDADAFDQKKAEFHMALWAKEKEAIRRAVLLESRREEYVQVPVM